MRAGGFTRKRALMRNNNAWPYCNTSLMCCVCSLFHLRCSIFCWNVLLTLFDGLEAQLFLCWKNKPSCVLSWAMYCPTALMKQKKKNWSRELLGWKDRLWYGTLTYTHSAYVTLCMCSRVCTCFQGKHYPLSSCGNKLTNGLVLMNPSNCGNYPIRECFCSSLLCNGSQPHSNASKYKLASISLCGMLWVFLVAKHWSAEFKK